MSDLTKAYLEAHRVGINTPESWGRAITEMVVTAAEANIGLGSTTSASVPVEFTLKPFVPAGCVQICCIINGVQVCYHLNT